MVAAEVVAASCSLFRRNSSPSRTAPSLTYSPDNAAAFLFKTSKPSSVFAAKMKGGDGDDEEYSSRRPVIRLPRIPASPTAALAARSAVAVFALGFVDAGYSGDWSRIGAVSKEVEDWLKIAAFFVVPLCVLVVVSIKSREEP